MRISRSRTLVTSITALLALGLLAACGEEDGTAGPSETPTATGSATPSETTPATEESLVYFMRDTRAGLRLVREPRDVSGSEEEQVAAAVEAMISGAEDPDYSTTWNPDTEVLGVEIGATDQVTVDLSADARTANVGSPGAALMIQQLVWTATEAIGNGSATVVLTIEGEPAGELWGAVSWDGPVGREDALGVRALVQIDTPREGAVVSSPVTITGDAAAFEANVPWRVLDEDGGVVQEGNTMTSEGMTFAPYSFEVALDPGTYVVEISEDDPSGGEGGEPTRDTRTIVVE